MNTIDTEYTRGRLERSELLLGQDTMARIKAAKVIIFGIGGVGSWCAECLVRSGIRHLTIVDNDSISITNANRQLMATSKTVGQSKTEALRERLMEIAPDAMVTAIEKTYCEETYEEFAIADYDYVVDAIDSLKDKISLIVRTTALTKAARDNGTQGPTLFSSMGAALRIDPTMVRVAEFWKVRNDTLGAILRKRMRQKKLLPATKFLCVYSEELPMENRYVSSETCSYKAQINGSLAHITAIYGFTLAGLILKEIYADL